MGKLLISHRSTKYPCCLPTLGDSMGAGRIRLTQGKVTQSILSLIRNKIKKVKEILTLS